jgi:hypothetical protein
MWSVVIALGKWEKKLEHTLTSLASANEQNRIAVTRTCKVMQGRVSQVIEAGGEKGLAMQRDLSHRLPTIEDRKVALGIIVTTLRVETLVAELTNDLEEYANELLESSGFAPLVFKPSAEEVESRAVLDMLQAPAPVPVEAV